MRRVPFLQHILRREQQDVHVERKHVDFALIFAGYDGRAWMGGCGVCAASHSGHAFCDVDDNTSMLRGKSADCASLFLQVGRNVPDPAAI